MSAFDRAFVRETTIWPPFIHTNPFDHDVAGMRKIIFGLYAMTYRQGFAYLEEVTAEELQRLLDQYEASMAELDADQQALVIDIASRRYVDAIDRAIKQAGLETKARGLDAKEIEVGYKEDALEVDRAELQTKREQIQLAKDKAEVAIKELEAKIQLEGLEQKMAEVDVARRQLELQKTILAAVEAALKGINIQISIADAAYDLVAMDAEKAKLIADLSTLDAQIARTFLAKLELNIDQAELDAIKYDITETLGARLKLMEARRDTALKELEGLEDQTDRAALIHLANLDEQIARTAAALQRISDREAEAVARKDIRKADAAQDLSIALAKNESEIQITEKRTDVPRVRAANQRQLSEAAIEAAKTIAMANIVNTLTHQIAKA